jgi:hypothetical protein
MAGWTQADIDKLRAAIATGALSVSYAGPPARSITYRSMDDMLKALAMMERSVNGGTPYRLAKTRKGF